MERSDSSLLQVALLVLLAVGPITFCVAADEYPPYLAINGQIADIPTSAPILTAGEMLVPLEDLAAVLDCQLTATAENSYRLVRGDVTLEMSVDQANYTVNGQAQTFTIFPVLVGGIVYVDAKDIATALGGKYAWNKGSLTGNIGLAALDPVRQVISGALVYVDKRQTPPFFLLSTPQGATSVHYGAAQISYLQSAPSGDPVAGSLEALQVQDNVELGLDRDNKVARVTLVRAYLTGVVEFRGEGFLLARVNNQPTPYNLPANVKVVTDEGKASNLAAVKQGQNVALLLDRDGKNVLQIVVESPSQAAKPKVTSVALDGYAGPVKQGQSITVVLKGTAKGTATFAIEDVVETVPMVENPQGTYKGSYLVDRETLALNKTVRGRIAAGGVESAAVAASTKVIIDTDTPRFGTMTPADGARVPKGPMQITVDYSDGRGCGVDTARVAFRMDGQDLSRAAKISATGLTYSGPELAPGAHEYSVTIVDRAGNARMQAVKFTVLEATVAILAVSHNATAALAPGDTLAVTLEATAAGRGASFVIGSNWRRVDMVRQGNTAVYTGAYVVQAGDSINAAPVVGNFVDAAGKTHSLAAEIPVTFTTALPTQLQILSPAEGYRHANLNEKLVVSGHATPGSRVRVSLRYSYLFSTKQLDRDIITASGTGRWETKALNMKLSGLKAALVTGYEVVADVLDAQDKVLETKSLKIGIGEEPAEG